MSVFDVQIGALTGDGFVGLEQFRGNAMLVVNLASKCGLTPQYAGLQALHQRYADRGLTVLGVPSNQFADQEPGTPAEIAEFARSTFGATFPMTEKIDVNGPGRHPLYAALVDTPDPEGHSGDVRWNFEKFLVGPDGKVVARFAPQVEPESPEITAAVERVLPR
ncbi:MULTISPECIES: glutathione peroxidase [unclassified Plantactinospora]|uniref:glutathione peroxidase n=1 Tax=unclassified Plantactinospora TaxID=2631981 RepID=UPI000D152767|nr:MULTISPECIES: glutathione peroxidase [unclassified Plantactinospora]AVT33744.1 glutathione peroxidase [Plantactinospora sp. BC1]AVT39423.1 glutathione peroxidase [Plantactinospora sp. BB1]